MVFTKKIKNYVFVAPSNTKDKKYDVYDYKTGKKLVSFGNVNYEHYKDKISYYSDLDHNDKLRRKNFKKRFERYRHIINSPAWFSDKFLW